MRIWPEGVAKRVRTSVDSTMAEAARLAPSLTGPTWVLALEQTSGRGRRGRAWVQPPGNFSATLIFQPTGPIETRAQRSFIAALALREAVIEMSGQADGLALKWPNDVLLNGGKLAGILLESVGDHLAIGIGVNLVASPPVEHVEKGAVPPVNLLAMRGFSPTPEEFLTSLAAAFAHWEEQFNTYGFAPIRREWLKHAARLGEVITARLPNDSLTGTFETVDEHGVLVLRTGKGLEHIAAADVFF